MADWIKLFKPGFVWSSVTDDVPRSKPRNQTRPLNDSDFIDFDIAAKQRLSPRTREEIIAYIKQKNPARWWRMNQDFKWLKKQFKKLGLNPDDAREILP